MTGPMPPDDVLFPEREGSSEPATEPEPTPEPALGPAATLDPSGPADAPAPGGAAADVDRSFPLEALVAPRRWLEQGQRVWIPLEPGDRPAVAVGDTVTPITVVAEHVRDTRLVGVAVRDRDTARFPPGAAIGPRDTRSGRRRGSLTDDGTVLYRWPATRVNVVVGRQREPLHARVDGTVVAVAPGGIALLVKGQLLPGVAGAGHAVHGRLRMAVADPGDELRSAGLHVADAGSIVVGGARVDVETLTRARALGIHGVVVGGIAGHDLRSFARSEARQRAAYHSLPPFAVLVLEGFGRRSLAGPPWELLLAAAGTNVSIFSDPPALVFDRTTYLPQVAPGTVRIAAGPGAGTSGTIDGPPAMHRFDEGVHLLAVPFSGGDRRWIVALADLERFR